tara:strand:- start:146 stop:451 length:306 start_codon:yes stop_codon:yes gene_type:complete
MRPDKQKIIDEVWDEARVRSFLGKATPTQFGKDIPGDADFHLLLNAYRAMRVDDFKRFLDHYLGEGHQLDAKNENGLTLAEYLIPYKKSAPFISALKQASP